MKQEFYNLEIKTNGQKLYEFTEKTINWIKKNKFKNGILNLSIQHTSASLIVQENADPDVQTDLINYFNNLVPMDSSLYIHTTEGKDDMPAHIKSSLTNNQIVAFILSILFSFLFTISGFPLMINFITGFLPIDIVELISSFSFLTHFSSIQTGFFSIKGILFFVSFTALWNLSLIHI